MGNAYKYIQCCYTAHLMWTTDGSKRLISSKDVPFEGVNNVPLHFGSQKPPKTEILVPWIALSIVNVFARSLLPRVYIAECFWFFCVVVEVQKVPFGSRAFLRLLVGELGTPKIAQILLWEMPVYIHTVILHRASDLGQRRPKTFHSEQRYAFSGAGVNDVPLNFESIPPKLKFWSHE